jgi:hypothetical protein
MPALLQSDDTDPLAVQLRSADRRERAEAAARLQERGPEAQGLLCAALRDGDLEVELAAIHSLGAIGDEAAIEPLLAAWRSCFTEKSARRHLVFITLGLAAAAMQLAGWIWSITALRVVGLLIGLLPLFGLGGGSLMFQRAERRKRDRYCQAITEAVERIALRQPSPRVRQLLPELRAQAVNVLEVDRSLRAASTEAADRLDQLTARVNAMPVPSEAPPPDPRTLPRPVNSPGDTTPG